MPTLLASFKSLFKPRPVKLVGAKLYASCVAQARLPVFYLDYGVEDAIGARFELLALHVILVVTRLKSLPVGDSRHEQALDTSQNLFDAFLLALDSALREQGTGDLTVPKKMKRLGIVVYTRMKRWDEMWRDGAPLSAQADYAARTIFAGSAYGEGGDTIDEALVPQTVAGQAEAFAAYIMAAHNALDIDKLLAAEVNWPVPAPLETAPDSADPVAVDA